MSTEVESEKDADERDYLTRIAKMLRMTVYTRVEEDASLILIMGPSGPYLWNPLRYMNDAADLVVRLKITVHIGSTHAYATEYVTSCCIGGQSQAYADSSTESLKLAWRQAVCDVALNLANRGRYYG